MVVLIDTNIVLGYLIFHVLLRILPVRYFSFAFRKNVLENEVFDNY
jgi:hypothetical protein